MSSHIRSQTLTGILMALSACILWSFNFVISRGINNIIPPISFAFYRWTFASIILLPIAWKKLQRDKKLIGKNLRVILIAGIAGTSLYSPLIYVAGHFSPAVNLALIGTTASPVFTLVLAAIFLKEKIALFRLVGLLICITGIIILLSKGSWDAIIHFRFTTGDKWMLLAAFCFSIYNITVRKKSPALSPLSFLFATFVAGIAFMSPAYAWELSHAAPVAWNTNLLLLIAYSGAGTSVIAFFCWNGAINRIGSARTAIFANMIPVLASLEAIWLLHESVSLIQILSMCIVITGLILATSNK